MTEQPDQGDTAPRRSIVETWIEVVADVSGLIQVEAKLARAEVADNLAHIGRSTLVLLAGGTLFIVALIFLAVAGVVALAQLIGWLWALIAIAAVSLVVGLLLIRAGQKRLEMQSILPERTLDRVTLDLQRMSERVDAPETYEDENGKSRETGH